MDAKTGLHAMRIAEKIRTNEEWKQKKVKVMESIITEKLRVSDSARNLLKDSGSKEIIEDTSHEFWGRGKTGQGLNTKLWMEMRRKLQKDPNFPNRDQKYRPGQQRHRNNRPQNKAVSRTWATRDQQPRCYQCGEAGHGVRQCRKTDCISCWACGLTGHKRKDCSYFSRQPRTYNSHYDDYSGYNDYNDYYDY
jgi:hypothetical protein